MIVNIGTTSGTDFLCSFLYRASPGGAAIIITGCTLQMMVRVLAEDITANISLTSLAGGGITITNSITGAFTVMITKLKLNSLQTGKYVHNLTITWPDGHIDEIWHGTLTHVAGPTR